MGASSLEFPRPHVDGQEPCRYSSPVPVNSPKYIDFLKHPEGRFQNPVEPLIWLSIITAQMLKQPRERGVEILEDINQGSGFLTQLMFYHHMLQLLG